MSSPTRSRRACNLALAAVAAGALAGGAVLTLPALAEGPVTAGPATIPTPTGTPVAPVLAAPRGAPLDTTAIPVRCTAGPSGVITFTGTTPGTLGALQVTGDTVCRPDTAYLPFIAAATADTANAGSHYAFTPTGSTPEWDGSAQDATGCLTITASTGGGTPVTAAFAQGTVSGTYAIPAPSAGDHIDFYGSGCRLHAAGA